MKNDGLAHHCCIWWWSGNSPPYCKSTYWEKRLCTGKTRSVITENTICETYMSLSTFRAPGIVLYLKINDVFQLVKHNTLRQV